MWRLTLLTSCIAVSRAEKNEILPRGHLRQERRNLSRQDKTSRGTATTATKQSSLRRSRPNPVHLADRPQSEDPDRSRPSRMRHLTHSLHPPFWSYDCVAFPSGDPDFLGVAVAPKQERTAGAAEVFSHQPIGRQGVFVGGGTVNCLHHPRSYSRAHLRVRLSRLKPDGELWVFSPQKMETLNSDFWGLGRVPRTKSLDI